MNWAALAESGAILATGLSAARMYASERQSNGGAGEMVLQTSIDQLAKLSEKLNSFQGTMTYVKQAVTMFQKVLMGVFEIAKVVKPEGLDCLANKECLDSLITKDNNKTSLHDVSKIILNGGGSYLKEATLIQEQQMVQTTATPTLLFIPSFEIYGYVLLLLDQHELAKLEFEKSIQYRMGRIHSLVGLARSNAMLGNHRQANYFYKFILDQLSDADDGNAFAKEAGVWFESKNDIMMIRESWKWPYL